MHGQPVLATGKLACLDGFMNIALEQTEEYVNGQVSAATAIIIHMLIVLLAAQEQFRRRVYSRQQW